ncbi:hypothetical protein [Weissella minor]|uniref:Uncharacterized protein n=1 Tax=Weissella minor TaxID=1620 RepID=A0A0R2JTY1_9LACO|nr:hypothetical protein [Weissella minor]KRN77597.1 hypothetical protein IV67_GL001440 [Weissella minor]
MENNRDFTSEISDLREFIKYQEHFGNSNSLVLYGGFAAVILSKNLFPKNSDIKKFLEINGIFLKEYVYSSRTQLIARMIRVVQKNSFEENKKLVTALEKVIIQYELEGNNEKKPEKSNKKNTVDQLLTQFGRHE